MIGKHIRAVVTSIPHVVIASIKRSKMKTVRMVIELTYDEELMYGDDPDAMEWFYEDVLAQKSEDGKLALYSSEIGDFVGEVTITLFA